MRRLKGTPASPGIVIGRAFHVQRTRAEVVYQETIGPGQVVSQLHALEMAVGRVEAELKAAGERVRAELPTQAAVIDAHLLILRDPMFYQAARRLIEDEQVTAAWAVVTVARQIEARFAQIDDSYLRSRVEDLESVAELVVRRLSGATPSELDRPSQAAILVAHHLSPADTTHLDVGRVRGFITEMGGRTSHTAIVAQALELPAVVGLAGAMARIPSGSLIILDGSNGRIIVDPDEETLVDFQERQDRYTAQVKAMRAAAQLPALTRDGRPVTVLANIEQPHEAASALAQGAEGIGLFRTEFLYLSQTELPTEEQLYQAYLEVVEVMAGRPVTIRTLDLGGDKFAHHIDLVPEMNPAMGLRAVRLCLRRPDIFRTQLRAILRASAHGRIKMMFPMISGVEELTACLDIFGQCRTELRVQGLAFDPNIAVGCMIEVPSAVLVADHLAKRVNFFSIGTNDLIQYALAIDRVNEYVAHMYRPFHPAVLRMIQAVLAAGSKAGIPVAMCGEMAAEPTAGPVLLGLGLTELSVNPQAVPKVKQMVRQVRQAEWAQVASQVLACETEPQVADLVRAELSRLQAGSLGPDGATGP